MSEKISIYTKAISDLNSIEDAAVLTVLLNTSENLCIPSVDFGIKTKTIKQKTGLTGPQIKNSLHRLQAKKLITHSYIFSNSQKVSNWIEITDRCLIQYTGV